MTRLLDRAVPVQASETWLASKDHVLVAVVEDGMPVGLAYGYRLARPDGKPAMLLLYSIDVLSGHRRQGLGRALLGEMRRHAPGGMWLLTNESNAAGMALYQTAGGTRPFDDDVLWRFGAPSVTSA